MSEPLPHNDHPAVLTLLLCTYYLQLMDQASSLVETVAVLALDCRQQVAGGGKEAEQVLGGGETPPLPHQHSNRALPLPNTLDGTLPLGLQRRELRNKFRSWEKQMVRESRHEHVEKNNYHSITIIETQVFY